MREELTHRVEESGGLVTLVVRGELTARGGVALLATLRTLLLDRGRLLVEVAGMGVGWPAAPVAFPTALGATGAWPVSRSAPGPPGPRLTSRTGRDR